VTLVVDDLVDRLCGSDEPSIRLKVRVGVLREERGSGAREEVRGSR
jgi:hypothetical protein